MLRPGVVVIRLLLSSKRGPQIKTHVALGRINIWLRIPPGPETRNHCGGEGQQQITALHITVRMRIGPQWVSPRTVLGTVKV
jgi:hypothetical protein